MKIGHFDQSFEVGCPSNDGGHVSLLFY